MDTWTFGLRLSPNLTIEVEREGGGDGNGEGGNKKQIMSRLRMATVKAFSVFYDRFRGLFLPFFVEEDLLR